MRLTAEEARSADALRGELPLDDYQRGIATGLERVYRDPATATRDLQLEAASLIVFSDHHRGERDGADDFRRCEQAYRAALGYYLEAGHSLVLLGDVEELWECRPAAVLGSYGDTLALESEFHSAGRLERLWGNHDDEWSSALEAARRFGRTFVGLSIREGLKLRVLEGDRQLGLLFLTHGHQGDVLSDEIAELSRLAVRHVWRPLQRRFKFASTATPSRDFALRERHDVALFQWALRHPDRPVLVAGHTHRPVFWTSQPAGASSATQPELLRELEALRRSGATAAELAAARARLEFARAEARRADGPATAVDPPCYFNAGCCSYGDGDVTGIEIAGGEIRLVRWPGDDGEPAPKVLASASLREVLRLVAARP